MSYHHIWNHLINSGVTHYCGAPTVQVSPRLFFLLLGALCSVACLCSSLATMVVHGADTGCGLVQIGLVNAPLSRRLEKTVHAIIAGSAPTAHLISELEKRNIKPVHVYGLTCVSILSCDTQ